MNFKIAMVCGAMMLACIGAHSPVALAAAENMVAQASSDSGFRVGDTLPPVKPRTPSGDYEDIAWDALLPEGWSVEKVMEDLNLNALGDNDPKAREALKKIREMWDNAPANPKLDNRRVSIAGFVVPLDGEREKTREFLLVPYFGACIHAPAPPANQVIHVVVTRPRHGQAFAGGLDQRHHSCRTFGHQTGRYRLRDDHRQGRAVQARRQSVSDLTQRCRA